MTKYTGSELVEFIMLRNVYGKNNFKRVLYLNEARLLGDCIVNKRIINIILCEIYFLNGIREHI